MSKVLTGAGRPLRGKVEVPGDKSISHRALILGALSEGEFALSNLPAGRDVLATRRCLERMGIGFSGTDVPGTGLVVRGKGLRGLSAV